MHDTLSQQKINQVRKITVFLLLLLALSLLEDKQSQITCKKQSHVAVILCTMYKLCYVVALFPHLGAPVLCLEKT